MSGEDRACPIYSASKNEVVPCIQKKCAWYNAGTEMCCTTTIMIAAMYSKNNGVDWSVSKDGDGNVE